MAERGFIDRRILFDYSQSEENFDHLNLKTSFKEHNSLRICFNWVGNTGNVILVMKYEIKFCEVICLIFLCYALSC